MQGGRSILAAVLVAIFASTSSASSTPAIAEPSSDSRETVDASKSLLTTSLPAIISFNKIINTTSELSLRPTETTTLLQGNVETASPSDPSPLPPGEDAYLVCHNIDGSFAPFCKPDNGSEVYVDENYYVTWDTSYVSERNSSVVIQGDYLNATGGGKQAFHSPFTRNDIGSIAITIDKEWLQGKASNNVTLYFFPISPSLGVPIRISGPTLMVTRRKYEPYRQKPTQMPKDKSLYIALPAVLGFVILCVIGGFFFNREQRRIGLGNVMGRRRGYGIGKSRSQRIGLKRKEVAIELRDRELTSKDQYRDVLGKGKSQDRYQERADPKGLDNSSGDSNELRGFHFGQNARR